MINLSISNIIVVLIIFFIYGIYFLYEHSDFIDDMFYTETFVTNIDPSKVMRDNETPTDTDYEASLNEPTEKQFFNAVDENNKILHSFCKKLNVLDKPSQSNLIFNRFSKEFIEKKNQHIKKLEKQISELQEDLYNEDIKGYNMYKLRTNDQAKKQYEAIQKGIDNINDSKKFRINLS